MNIIQDFMENGIKNLFELLGKELKNKGDFSKFVLELKKQLDSLGIEICKTALAAADEAIRIEPNGKNQWVVERRDKKTLLTTFGEIKYERTYYKSKKDNEYKYLSDEFLGIDCHDRMDLSLKAQLVKEAVDVAYDKSAKKTIESIDLSSQTVMNTIRELGEIPNITYKDQCQVEESKKTKVKYLYVEADEDHVALQNGKSVMPRLVYVHEGYEHSNSKRKKLKNIHYFSGIYNNIEELWLEVVDYIYNQYDIDNIENIFVSGDGAAWIKQGISWIPKSVYLLDRFHINKYILKATTHNHKYRFHIWESINNRNLKELDKIFKDLIDSTENENKIQQIKDSRKYIKSNWEGIVNYYKKSGAINCSAEGHISHILSDRLSSRPLGWSVQGVHQMSRLRAYTANGGAIYELFEKTLNKKKNYFYLSKKVINSTMKNKCIEKFNNIESLNTGKKTGLNYLLKALRGA